MPDNLKIKKVNITEAIKSYFSDIRFDIFDKSLDRYRIPSSRVNAFELVTSSGEDGQFVKQIDGLIVHVRRTNSLFRTTYDRGATHPDCHSDDGVTGMGNPGGMCAACPKNVHGSGKGNAKACKNKILLYIQCAGVDKPRILILPATSIQVFEQYEKKVAGAGKNLAQVMTRIALERAQNSAGITYSKATFEVLGVVSEEDLAAVYERYEHVGDPLEEEDQSSADEQEEDDCFSKVISFS